MKLITELNEQNGKLWKQACLKGISNPDWSTFVVAYDPYSMYHQKFKDYDMDNLGEPSAMMFNILEKLTTRQVTGQAARDMVINHAKREGDLIKLICNKDLRCGVTATTFNKAHPGSIPVFNVQLAKEVPVDTLKYPLIAQIKYDGVRLIAINDSGVVTFRTRNGNTVNLPKLQALLESVGAHDYILDGEIVYNMGTLDGRTGISGAINSAMHGGTVDESDMVLHVFDAMKLQDWQAAKCIHPYNYRFQIANAILDRLSSDQFRPAPSLKLESPKDVELYFEVLLEQGYEGLILKSDTHKYTFKRSKDWVKLKEIKTVELNCFGWKEGDGKYTGQIGTLSLEGEVEGEHVVVQVGSGLTDEDRARTTDGYMDYYLDELIEIKYNSVIPNATKTGFTLFLPRFVRVRTDK
jgi:ATP-dependent DNA ligase